MYWWSPLWRLRSRVSTLRKDAAIPRSIRRSSTRAYITKRRSLSHEAIEHYRSALRFAERPGAIELRLADALVQTGAYEEAIERYRRALWRVDADPETLNRVAWLLATCPQTELRDCRPAIRLAEQVCRMTDHCNAASLDTLAAAYAECGRLSEAVTWVKAAIGLSMNADDSAAIEPFRMRLRLYEERLGRDVHPRPGGP